MYKENIVKEIRCGNCDKLLGRGEAYDLAIKCPRCKCINHVRNMNPNLEPHDGHMERTCQHSE